MSDDEIERELTSYRHFWDGTEDWEFGAFYRTETELFVVFEGERPTLRELVALRKLDPRLCDVPPAEARARGSEGPRYSLGESGGIEAPDVCDRAAALGLTVEGEDRSGVSYLSVRQNGDGTVLACIIDDDLARRVAERMIAAGRPVAVVEED